MFLTKEDLLKLARAYSKLPILEEVAAKKAKIDVLQNVISQDQRLRLDQKIRLDWNFHSNCIEGNSLTLGQTTALIMYGLTASGKPFKDYIDIKNHDALLKWVIEWSKDKENTLSERAIRDMHTLLMGETFEMQVQTDHGQINKTYQSGAYKTENNHTTTITGETHTYAPAIDTPLLMQELLAFYYEAIAEPDVNPLAVAALFHYQFVSIHPFPDGNGRLVRLLMNLILMQQKYQPVIIRSNPENKNAYFTALQQAHTKEYEPFINLIAEYELAACDLFIKAATNESIEEPDDIDKEIALLEKSIADKAERALDKQIYTSINSKTVERIYQILKQITSSFKNLFLNITTKTNNGFENLFTRLMTNSNKFSNKEIIINFKNYIDKKNSVDFEVQLMFIFNQFDYQILFYIGNKQVDEIDIKVNYPHQMTDEKIQELKLAIKKAILNFIKSKITH